MANPEKHKMNPIVEWLEDADESAPARPSAGGSKALRTVSRKARTPLQASQPVVAEPALMMREPGQPVKLEEKHSQANSREHLRKQQRLAGLRAPHSRSAGAGR